MVEAKRGTRRSPISERSNHIAFIELIENTLNTPPGGGESLYERQSFIMRTIEDLQAYAAGLEVELELELSIQYHSTMTDSVDAVLDALGHPPLRRLPAELQIEIKFSLNRLGLDTSRIFPNQNKL